MQFLLAIEKGDDQHAYGVVVPALPGCFSAGNTLEEALANAREAIIGHLETMLAHGQEVPTANSHALVDECCNDPERADWILASLTMASHH